MLVCRPIVFGMLVATSTLLLAAGESDYYDLGGFHYPVDTESVAAQQWFDRGLAMCHGFNHEEAVRCFEKALAADPGMAMAYWGLAYAWGPNINNMQVPPAQRAQAELAVRLAELQLPADLGLEAQLVHAISHRCRSSEPVDDDAQNSRYAEAMREVYQQHRDDPLVATLFAEALMNLQPWRHWAPDGTQGPHTAEILRVLEAGLERSPGYPGLCHFYIHAQEASPDPAKALSAANQLRDAMPDQGHLLHMPSHIDIWLGDYDAVIRANKRAIAADAKYLAREGPNNFYTFYRIHNYHFLVYGAMFDGQSRLALDTARALKEQVPEPLLQAQVDLLDAFMPTDLHVLVRFGRWQKILEQPEPADYLPVSRSIWHYARGLAYAATNRIDQAEAEQQSFLETIEEVPETSYLFQNASLKILEVAEAMLAGEIAYRRGEYERAFEKLRLAVQLDDNLNYDEPWGWMQPTRHALGALLSEQGRYAEAEPVYRADLERHPNNPWSLAGLAECLTHLGRKEEAQSIQQELAQACKRSDVTIDRACYCKLQ